MINNRKEILLLAQDFADKCKDNNIWYTISNNTLLGAVRHGGFLPWSELFEINVLPEGYNILKKLFPQNIVDSTKSKYYQDFTVTWVKNIHNWANEDTFLEIKILIPTTMKKVKKYKSLFWRIWNFITGRKHNIKLGIDTLMERKLFEGYLEIINRKQDLRSSWYQAYNFDTITKKMNGFNFQAPKNFDRILKYKFGKDYMTNIVIPDEWEVYLNPILREKVW